MVRVEEACQIIEAARIKVNRIGLPIHKIIGRVLAEEIKADRDFPPFNRVAMDGIAIQSKAFHADKTFFIEGIQAAGAHQQKLQQEANCLEVMTGAVLPEGADAVIRYEDIEVKNQSASVKLENVHAGMNIHAQGLDARKGDVLLSPGQLISPAEVSLMASVGAHNTEVFEFPKTALLSSGDEMVEITMQPKPYQIRRSNVYALQAAMQQSGWNSNDYHVADDKAQVKEKLSYLLQENDVLILSGGVSKGKFDFIPETLADLGVKKLFQGVSQRPGKPFWFGSVGNKVVFALPGNPVSTFLCYYKYIKPWILSQMGVQQTKHTAILTNDFQFHPPLTHFLQVAIRIEQGLLNATPIPGGGSGDFVNLKAVNGFLELPMEQSQFKAGEIFPYIPFR